MGNYLFRIPESWQSIPSRFKSIHVIGLDGIPRPCATRVSGDLLTVSRNESDSGRTYICYPFADRGEMMICTGTLPESEQPYQLLTELARGTVNRLQNQTSIWQEGGLEIPARVRTQTDQAISELCTAVVTTGNASEQAASNSLDHAIEAIFALSSQFGQDIARFRVSQPGMPEFWLASEMDGDFSGNNELTDCFGLVETGCVTGEIQQRQSQPIILGPLVDLSPMSGFGDGGTDFRSRSQSALQHCRTILKSLPQQTTLIHAVCGLSGIGHAHASYREQFQLTSDLLEFLENTGSNVPVMVSFNFPWVEQMGTAAGALHPLQIAEDLVRGGSRISCFGLDINLDYWPHGSVARDPLQWIELIDLWSQLGLPLVLCLRVPIFPEQPPGNVADDRFDVHHSGMVTLDLGSSQSDTPGTVEIASPIVANDVRQNLDDSQRLQLLETVLAAAAARPGVHGIVFRQWSDNGDQRFPRAGLVDEFGHPKSIARTIEKFSQQLQQWREQ